MQTYTGEFAVEPNEFRLRAERMIIRQRPIVRDDKPVTLKQISFDLLYTPSLDAPEEYRLNGVANRQTEGYYESRFGSDTDYAGTVIYILKANVNEDGCFFEGFWFDRDEGAWRFSGNLETFNEVE